MAGTHGSGALSLAGGNWHSCGQQLTNLWEVILESEADHRCVEHPRASGRAPPGRKPPCLASYWPRMRPMNSFMLRGGKQQHQNASRCLAETSSGSD